MQIAGQDIHGNIEDIIYRLQHLPSGFMERTSIDYNGFYDDSATLHASFLRTLQIKENIGSTSDAAALMRINLRPMNPEAVRVEQGEVGFSTDKPIGTDNIQDCISIILRDPITHKTSLAHIDWAVSQESLQTIMNGMPPRKPSDPPLEARIVGARFIDDPKQGFEREMNENGRKNIEKVIGFLADKPVNIISADILNAHQPAAIVADPKTFTLSERVPGQHNPDIQLVNGRSLVGDSGNRPIHSAFDLTVSAERNPMLLDAGEVSRLHERFLGKTPQEIEAAFRKTGRTDYWLDQPMVRQAALTQAYEKSLAAIIGHLDAQIANLGEQGVHVPASERAEAVKILNEKPLYVGQNADTANKPLMDFVDHKLFTYVHGEQHLNATDLQDFDPFALSSPVIPNRSPRLRTQTR